MKQDRVDLAKRLLEQRTHGAMHIVENPDHSSDYDVLRDGNYYAGCLPKADAEFIAESPTLMQEALKEIDRLRSVIRDLVR